MDQRQNRIKQIIKPYLDIVEKCFFLERVYVFGSYARNEEKEYSDLDLALVSNDFKNFDEMALLSMLYKIAMHIDSKIEPVIFEPCDLDSPPLGTLAWEIVHNGLLIK